MGMNASLFHVARRHIQAELSSPMMWLGVALSPLILAGMSGHGDFPVHGWFAVFFWCTATAVGWLIGLPLAVTMRLALMRIGMGRIAAVFVTAFVILFPITIALELLESLFLNHEFHPLNVARCYGHLLGASVIFALSLDYLVGRPADMRIGTDRWFAEALERSLALRHDAAPERESLASNTGRQIVQIMRSQLFWMMAATFYAAFTLLGPVGTYDALTIPERLGVFAVVFAIIIFVAGPPIVAMRIALSRRGWNIYGAIATAAAVGGLALCYPLHLILTGATGGTMSFFEAVTNYIVFTPALVLGAVLTYEIVTIGAGVPAEGGATLPDGRSPDIKAELLPDALDPAQGSSAFDQQAGAETHPRAAILELVPLEKRAHLVSLTAEDHYVRIATEKADHLVRMRMCDAVEQAAPLKGIRIHRSSWVALCAIKKLEREGRATFALLANGQRVRLSRAGVKLYRELVAV